MGEREHARIHLRCDEAQGNLCYHRFAHDRALLRRLRFCGGGRVHQVLATLGYGDAIGHEVLGIQRVLQDAGYDSEIFVETADRRLEHLTTDYRGGGHFLPNEKGIGREYCQFGITKTGQ